VHAFVPDYSLSLIYEHTSHFHKYTAAMGSADIDIEWNNEQWAADMVSNQVSTSPSNRSSPSLSLQPAMLLPKLYVALEYLLPRP